MKKVTLIKSIKDLAAVKAEALCDKSKPYYQTFVAGMEKKLVDDLVARAIDQENAERIKPVLRAFIKEGETTPIPVPFEMYGKLCTQIKRNRYSLEVSYDNENWLYLDDDAKIRLYEALETAGCLDNIE